jgi:hypothetical protein
MKRETNLLSLDENLINCVQECLSKVSCFSDIAKNLSKSEIKKIIKKENLEANKDEKRIIKKNNFEIITNSIISMLGNDKFKTEKTSSPEKCPFCNINKFDSFEINYIKINLDNYLGKEFNLNDFFDTVKGKIKCRNCKKETKMEFNFTSLPEVLVIILGSKSENKNLKYEYNTTFKYFNKKNNSTSDSHYILKGLIGQIDLLKFKSFLFDNEKSFKKDNEKNEEIFSNPTILFYEGPKKKYNEDNEYLEPDDIEMEDENGDNKITVYFNFEKYGKKIYIDIDPNVKLSEALSELREKYNWFKHLKNFKFYLNNKLLSEQKTLKENGIQDGSEINII